MKENKPTITVQTTIIAPLEKVWEYWTSPAHITNWNFANAEWCCPSAVNDLSPKKEFNWRMEAKDGSMGFDFTGVYSSIIKYELITYQMADGRTVKIEFSPTDLGIKLSETFDAEETNSDEQQRAGWQAILENFKRYTESN